MRVKVGDTWYDAKDQPICIQMSEGDQRNIANMDRAVATEGKYAIFPGAWGTPDQMREWMETR